MPIYNNEDNSEFQNIPMSKSSLMNIVHPLRWDGDYFSVPGMAAGAIIALNNLARDANPLSGLILGGLTYVSFASGNVGIMIATLLLSFFLTDMIGCIIAVLAILCAFVMTNPELVNLIF